MLLPILLTATLTTWLLALSLVAALCQSARQGDLPHPETQAPQSSQPPANVKTKTRVIARRSPGKPTSLGDPTRPTAQLEPYSAFLASTPGGCKNRPANVCITRSTAVSTVSTLECNTRSGREGTW
jgi:hypothetical protein